MATSRNNDGRAERAADAPTAAREGQGGGETWPDGVGPTREELVAALRTFVSLAACWLDRDPVRLGADAKNHKDLVGVVKALADVAARQREESSQILAGMFRDDIAVTLGAPSAPGVSGGTVYSNRASHYRHLPSTVPADFSTSLIDWRGAEPPPAAVIVTAILSNYDMWCARSAGSAVAASAPPRPTSQEAEALAVAALATMATPKRAANADLPTLKLRAANTIVAKVLGLSRAKYKAGDVSELGLERRFEDYLHARHPDRPGNLRTEVDTGNYFGARSTPEPAAEERDTRHARSWSAASLLGEVCDGGVELSEWIFDFRRDFKMPWHVWRESARGFPQRPQMDEDLYAMAHAMARFQRGIAPNWPKSKEYKPLDIAVDRCREYVDSSRALVQTLWSAAYDSAVAEAGGESLSGLWPQEEPRHLSVRDAVLALQRSVNLDPVSACVAARSAASANFEATTILSLIETVAVDVAVDLCNKRNMLPAQFGLWVREANALPAAKLQTVARNTL